MSGVFNMNSNGSHKTFEAPKDWTSRETNMNKLMVYPPGTAVLIGFGDDIFAAQVLAVAVYAHNIQYQVSWWDGRQRRTDWLEDFEVQSQHEGQKLPLGFA